MVGYLKLKAGKTPWLACVPARLLVTCTTRLLRTTCLCTANPNPVQRVWSSSFTSRASSVYPFTLEHCERWRISIFTPPVKDGRKGYILLRLHFPPAALKSVCSQQQCQLLPLQMIPSSLCGDLLCLVQFPTYCVPGIMLGAGIQTCKELVCPVR